MPASKAFLRELRRKHHLGEFSNKAKRKASPRTSRVQTKRRVHHMAKKKRSFHRGGGMNSLIKAALFGTGAAYLAPMAGVGVNSQIAGAAGGYFAGKNIQSAIVGAVVAPILLSKLGGMGGQSSASAYRY